MSKKRWFILGGVAILVLTISISAVLGKPLANLLNFKKVEGIKQVQEGVLVDLPTKKDKLDVVNSIDPKSGAPTQKLKAKAEDKNILIKNFVTDDTEKKLDVPYVKGETKDVAIYDPITTLTTIPIPGTDEYLITFDGTIYKTDWKNSKLKKFLKDEVNGYKKDVVLSYNIEQIGTPTWGTNPIVNPTGTYMLFFSDRSAINGNVNGEMWIKNLKTGDERPVLLEGSGTVVGWLNDTEIIFGGIEINLINLETGDVKKLLGNGIFNVSLAKDQLVYQTTTGTITLQSVYTDEETTISSPLIYSINSIQASGSWVAMHNQLRPGDAEFSVVLYNIDSEIWKEITAPTNTWIDGFSWVNDSTLHILTSTKGTTDEATYIVNIDEVEVAE